MIVEYTWNTYELRQKKCYECKWLTMIDNWSGHCDCPHNNVKIRNRQITDKKCVWKNADKAN